MASKEDSTGGTTPLKGKAVWAMAGVGGVRSSGEAMPDLWFGEPTSKRVRRGSFSSVGDLQKGYRRVSGRLGTKIQGPLLWTATVESIQQKLARCRQTLEQISPGCTQPRKQKTQETHVQLSLGHDTSLSHSATPQLLQLPAS